MQNFVIKHQFDDPLRSIYKNVIQPLIGSFFEVDAIFSPNKQFDQDLQSESQSKDKSFSTTIYVHSNVMDVEKELFLWAILTGKQELALLFWSRGKNKVCK